MASVSARTYDRNGFFRVERNPISRAGIFPYLGRSIGLTGEDAERTFMVYRPAEELSDPATLDSLRNNPIVDGHTMIGDEDIGCTPAERKGVGGVTGDNVEFDPDSGILYSNLKVWSGALARKIDTKDACEVSWGYRCKYDFTPGTFDGQKYDVVQRALRGNHVAVVKRGRMGRDVAVLDNEFTYDHVDVMELQPVLDKETLDAIDASVRTATETATATILAGLGEPITAAVTAAMDAADEKSKAKIDEEGKKDEDKAAKGEDKLEARVVAQDAEIAALKKQLADQPKGLDAKDVMVASADAAGLYARVKPHIGVFEHSGMDAADIAVYACDKLGLKPAAGAERATLDGFLHNRTNPTPVTTALDAEDASGSAVLTALTAS